MFMPRTTVIRHGMLRTGAQSVGGVKTFEIDPWLPADPYDVTNWDSNNEIPTKNDIRDKIESLVMGGWEEVLARNVFSGSASSYEFNNISGYRILKFIFAFIYSLTNAVTVRFETGVAGPTFRTSGYVGFSEGAALTTALAQNTTAGGGNTLALWVITVLNPDDSDEKTHGSAMVYDDVQSAHRSIVRYDTAEANTCFRVRETGGIDIFGELTILGRR